MQPPHTATDPERRPIEQLIEEIGQLPKDWHLAGMMSKRVLLAIARHAAGKDISSSLETGSGKTTLLFSHLSRNHTVFAVEGDNRSITVVRESPLLNRTSVRFVEGPTQLTLPRHNFTAKLQLALIDGPHGYPFPELEYYSIYPHLDTGAVLIVDDIHIPTIHRLYEFLIEDAMFELLEVVDHAAFFRRTEALLFDPLGDGWWLQEFNKRHLADGKRQTVLGRIRTWVPAPLKKAVKRLMPAKPAEN